MSVPGGDGKKPWWEDMQPPKYHRVQMWVGGHFVHEPKRVYIGGRSVLSCYMDLDKLNLHTLSDLYERAGGEKHMVDFYWKYPGLEIDLFLRKITAPFMIDHNIAEMVNAWRDHDVPVVIYAEDIGDPDFAMDTQGNILFSSPEESRIYFEKARKERDRNWQLVPFEELKDPVVEQDDVQENEGVAVNLEDDVECDGGVTEEREGEVGAKDSRETENVVTDTRETESRGNDVDGESVVDVNESTESVTPCPAENVTQQQSTVLNSANETQQQSNIQSKRKAKRVQKGKDKVPIHEDEMDNATGQQSNFQSNRKAKRVQKGKEKAPIHEEEIDEDSRSEFDDSSDSDFVFNEGEDESTDEDMPDGMLEDLEDSDDDDIHQTRELTRQELLSKYRKIKRAQVGKTKPKKKNGPAQVQDEPWYEDIAENSDLDSPA